LVVAGGSAEIAGDLSGSVTGNASTTVTGGGEIGGILKVSGILDPGSGVGTITAGTLQFQSGATLRVGIDSTLAYDSVASINAPSLGSAVHLELALAPGFDPVDLVDEFTLVQNLSGNSISLGAGSPFVVAGNALSEGERFVASGQAWEISYQGGTGNDVVIYAVPEPAMGLALMAGLTVLGLRRPRRM